MSLDADVAAILAANTSLSTVFTGGIVDYDQLGTLGLNRQGYPTAFDSTTGLLKPIIICRDRVANATFAMRGEQAQIESYLQAVEIALYCDRGTGYGILETAQHTIYGLLQDRNAGLVRLYRTQHTTNQREPLLDFACFNWDVYMGMGLEKP